MGEKKPSNDILSETAQQICSQKFMHTHRKGVYQSYKKKILDFWQLFCYFFLDLTMVVNGEL